MNRTPSAAEVDAIVNSQPAMPITAIEPSTRSTNPALSSVGGCPRMSSACTAASPNDTVSSIGHARARIVQTPCVGSFGVGSFAVASFAVAALTAAQPSR